MSTTTSTTTNKPLVWFITGTTSGFGSAIATAALKRGDHVIATARNPSHAALVNLRALGATTLTLDITASEEIVAAVAAEAIAVHGHIDILVNNAAYILSGTVEGCSAAEVFAQFNTNVFGQLSVLRAVLPYMRARKSGVVANMGSIGGWHGMSAIGMYCATKAAMMGISESLKQEVAHLGIDVVLVEPGYFRTGFLSSGHKVTAQKEVEGLEAVTQSANDALTAYDRKQPGDPEKGAQLLVEALTKTGRCEGHTLPNRLLMGTDAVEFVENVLERQRRELEEWRELTLSTDHDDVIAAAAATSAVKA